MLKVIGGEKDGVWAFDNVKDATSVSQDFYALVVPSQTHARLDDFSLREEENFWRLTFQISRDALLKLSESTSKVRQILIGVNDGVYAGQTVPHTHSHVAAVHEKSVNHVLEERPIINLKQEIEGMRSQFCKAVGTPVATRHAHLSFDRIDLFARSVRWQREVLRKKGADSFRIYSEQGIAPKSKGINMVIDGAHAQNPQFSVAKAMRVINGLMSPENLDNSFGMSRFSHFEPCNIAP